MRHPHGNYVQTERNCHDIDVEIWMEMLYGTVAKIQPHNTTERFKSKDNTTLRISVAMCTLKKNENTE